MAHPVTILRANAIVERLEAAAPFLAGQVKFEPANERGMPNALAAKVTLYGGVLSIVINEADEWDEAPIGSPIVAAGWGHLSNGAFTCGAYRATIEENLWDIAQAVSFAVHAGDVPSEDE